MYQKVVSLRNNLPATEIGGKAHSLNMLLDNGFDVPQGFVITASAFFNFLEHNALFNEIQSLALEITQSNFAQKSVQIREALLKGEMPEDVAAELNKFLSKLGAKYISTRSSAASEDSLKSSFAGLFDTFLNIKVELPLVLENIKKCWASLFNERALAYRIRKGIPHLEGMAVIVQEMIPAEVSGVAFTVHPSNENALLIEASYGLGDMTVGGKITPDDFIIDRKTIEILQKKVGNKEMMSICQDGEIKVIEVQKEFAQRQVLPDEKVKEIANLCLKVEKTFSYPQDIEWCICHDKLWLLQSRAITTSIR
jgi:pyruvate,water dikinase